MISCCGVSVIFNYFIGGMQINNLWNNFHFLAPIVALLSVGPSVRGLNLWPTINMEPYLEFK
jgi:hypothetical protein